MINFFRILIVISVLCSWAIADDKMVIPTRDPLVPAAIPLPISVIVTPSIIEKTQWFPLYFAKSDDVLSFLSNKENHILSDHGVVGDDKLNNQLWVRDDVKHLKQVHQIIQHLDKPLAQFLIKAKIVNLDRQYQKSLGVLFQSENAAGNPERVSARGVRGARSRSIIRTPAPILSTIGELTVTIADLGRNRLLDMQLSALEQKGHATLISNPALMTLNNHPALIESGDEVPYQEATASGATSVSFKKAVMRLQVTPRQMPNHHILLKIALNQDKVSPLTVNGVPAIQTQKLTTQVIVRDSETIVLGGILETTRAREVQGVPVIDQVPIVGQLFQHHAMQTRQEELLIFITPRMMRIQ